MLGYAWALEDFTMFVRLAMYDNGRYQDRRAEYLAALADEYQRVAQAMGWEEK